ncbi:MAG: DUF134 domain-containing protein [Planctomycetes bacterium]|jgi:predicted DNA-binding protein (UPF0251 family)|nr:DUF134 domain-containing protein [Planctomycetota bacterium]
MPRPCCLRHIGFKPPTGLFGPVGVSVCALEQVTLTLDEVEALRLADLNGLYQEQAAAQMKVSRPTFARIVEQARRKVAEALIHGKTLRLEGGAVRMDGETDTRETDGTGPAVPGQGRGAGPCGCGQRRGPQPVGGARFGRCCRRRGTQAAPMTEEVQNHDQIEKGEQNS